MAKLSLKEAVRQFNTEVKRVAANLTSEKVVLFHKKIALEALKRIVLKTPVDTGRARGNWQTTIGKLPAGDKKAPNDKSGSKAMMAGMAALASLPPFSVVWISNNVPYIIFLEAGSSKQAPQGMVAVTIQELLAMFR